MGTDTKNKRVFVLGAGFSKAAGMPDATEMSTLLLAKGSRHNNDEFQTWAKDFLNRISQLKRGDGQNEDFACNIEQLFDCAEFDRELLRMRQQICPVGPWDGETPANQAEAISSWLSYMETDLFGVLLERQERADHAIIHPFVEQLRNGDTILTFNYDTLLETCLAEAGTTWAHGFEVEPQAEVTMLKLHGSLDWWMSHRERPIPDATTLFEKRDLNFDWERASDAEKEAADRDYTYGLYRVSLEKSKALHDATTGIDKGRPRFLGLGGLGAHKPLHQLNGSGRVWQNAFDGLKQADEIIVVGWSCSPYDMMARFHLGAVMHLRDMKPSRILAVDPDQTGNVKSNLMQVFGELDWVCKKAENADWCQLLS